MPYKKFNQWAYPYPLSKFRRTQQWTVFARTWTLFDCIQQDVFDAARVIAGRLQGRHKPINDHKNVCGDHVICINTKELAMPVDEWRWRHYYHHSRYIKGRTWAPAFELHLNDPTIVLYKAIWKELNDYTRGRERKSIMARCHLFPDADVPKELMENVVDQIQQVQPVYKKLEEFEPDLVTKFPKITDFPDDYVISKPGQE